MPPAPHDEDKFPLDRETIDRGKVIFRTHTLSSVSLEEFVRRVRWSDPKVRVDWCFSGGVAEFSAQGDTERAKRAIWSQRHVHDVHFHREIRTLFDPHAIDFILERIWCDFGAVGDHGALRYPPDAPVPEPEAPACAPATCIAHLRPCSACLGVGCIDAPEDVYPCDECKGSGQTPLLASPPCGPHPTKCAACRGSGEILYFMGGDYDAETCGACGGRGSRKTWKDKCDQHLSSHKACPCLAGKYRRKSEYTCQKMGEGCPPREATPQAPRPEPIGLPEALAMMARYVDAPVGLLFHPKPDKNGLVCCTMVCFPTTSLTSDHRLPGGSLRGAVKEWLTIARETPSPVDPPDASDDIAFLESLLARMDAAGFGVSC